MVEYSAAKAALTTATVALAQELAGTGVTANVVSPLADYIIGSVLRVGGGSQAPSTPDLISAGPRPPQVGQNCGAVKTIFRATLGGQVIPDPMAPLRGARARFFVALSRSSPIPATIGNEPNS